MNILNRSLAVAVAAVMGMICLGFLFPIRAYLIWGQAIGALILIGLAVIARAIRTRLLDSSGATPGGSQTVSGARDSFGSAAAKEKIEHAKRFDQSNNQPTEKW